MARRPTIVPIFPLPDVVFFPHTMLSLHVFEARYRAMMVDTLARDRRLCVVRLRPGYEAAYAGKPPVHAVGGLGEIVSWERLANGRYNIVVRGDARLRIDGELPTDTLYRMVRGTVLRDRGPRRDTTRALRRIRAACAALLTAIDRPADLLDTAFAEGQPPGIVADRIAASVIPDAWVRQKLLETQDVNTRLNYLALMVESVVRELRGGRPWP
jgi:Lon protease-like protein